jgi:dTDP-4-amino-4,6-dideoxygalactose transaminase
MLLVSEPSLGVHEATALAEVIADNWITMGSKVRAFERAFATEHQVEDAVAVNSCTAGLHLALDALGIKPGDEVLVPSLTFVATANAVLYVGAKPVFVDIESMDLPHLSLADAAAKCTPRTRAVIVMHYAGYVAYADEWREFARSRGLLVIEDSAHAVGRGRVGLFGDVAVFSFYGNKNMTTAEGGMVVAADPEVLERVRQGRGHGMTSGTFDRLHARQPGYDVTMLGYNYRMNELSAALGLVQLQNLRRWNVRREELTRCYRAALARHCPDVQVPFSGSNARISAHHIMPVLLPEGVDRQQVAARMCDCQVQTTFHYPPIHRLTLYRRMAPDLHLEKTESFAERELTLPLHPKMEDWQTEMVALSLATALA